MKARSREINIFNMSLLDVLCGALGSFCFMMLTLFPYYSKAHMHEQSAPDAAAIRQQFEQAKRELEEAQRKIQQLEADARKSGDAAAMQQQLQQAKAQLQEAQRKVGQASKQIQQLELRYPVSVSIMWLTEKHDVDIYLWRPAAKPQPEPVLEHKNTLWIIGDNHTDWISGPGFETWQMRDLAPGLAAKLYYVLYNFNGNSAPAYVSGSILCSKFSIRIPPVPLDQQTRILHVADLARKGEDDLDVTYTPEFLARAGIQVTKPADQGRKPQ